MITINPFSQLTETIPSIALQSFVLVMVGLVAAGTILDIIHKIISCITIMIYSPTPFSNMLSASIPNKNMASVLLKAWVFANKAKILWLSWMISAKCNVFQCEKIIVAPN